MRLTKRQLKRIIREEYARLKRRGLINETRRPSDVRGIPRIGGGQVRDMRHSSGMQRSLQDMEDPMTMCIDECFDAVPPMMKQICSMGMAHTVTNDIYHICAPICKKYGCDCDEVSQIVEDMCCSGRRGR